MLRWDSPYNQNRLCQSKNSKYISNPWRIQVRNFIDIISGKNIVLKEARKKKTITGEPQKFEFLRDLETGKELTTPEDRSIANDSGNEANPGFRQARANDTRRQATTARMNHPGAGEAFMNMLHHGEDDDISDEEARRIAGHDEPRTDRNLRIGYDRPITNEQLPMIVNKEIEEWSGNTKLYPQWHQVKHLPGYILNAIRSGARKVFQQFTDTPIEDIQLVATAANLNSEEEVKAVMAWVKKNGVQEDVASMEFGGGIRADVTYWKTKDFSFLLVKDFMGYYVYSWVGGRGVHVRHYDSKKIK